MKANITNFINDHKPTSPKNITNLIIDHNPPITKTSQLMYTMLYTQKCGNACNPYRLFTHQTNSKRSPIKKIPVNTIVNFQCIAMSFCSFVIEMHHQRRHDCGQHSENIWQQLTTKYGGWSTSSRYFFFFFNMPNIPNIPNMGDDRPVQEGTSSSSSSIFKYSNIQIFKYSNIQIFKYSNIQMFKCSNVQLFKYSNIQMFRCSNFQMFKCSNVKMFKCSNDQMIKCSNVQMLKCSYFLFFGFPNIQIFICSNFQMFKCKFLKYQNV